jgi:hypothetical protein
MGMPLSAGMGRHNIWTSASSSRSHSGKPALMQERAEFVSNASQPQPRRSDALIRRAYSIAFPPIRWMPAPNVVHDGALVGEGIGIESPLNAAWGAFQSITVAGTNTSSPKSCERP